MPVLDARSGEHIEQPRVDDHLLVRALDRTDQRVGFLLVGNDEGEVALHRLERGRRIRRAHEARFALARNGIQEDFACNHRAGQAELLGEGWVQHAIFGENHLGAKAQRARLAGMIGTRSLAEILQIGDRGTRRREQGDNFALGIEGGEGLGLPGLPAARRLIARQYEADGRALALLEIASAKLEQPHRRGTAIHVAAGRGQKARQQRGPHDLEVFGDRVGQHPIATADRRGFLFGEEGPVDRFGQAARSRRAAHAPFDQLFGRGGGAGDARHARQRGGGDMIQADDPHDFLDQIGPAIDVAPPAWHGDGPMAGQADGHAVLIVEARRLAGNGEAQIGQDALLFVGGHIDTGQRDALVGIIVDDLGGERRAARAGRLASGAAA